MREIKFRAWNGKRMIYNGGWYISFSGKSLAQIVEPMAVDMKYFGSTDKLYCKDIDKYEVMQYTGLKDKNGKEIYEGDIVESPHFKDAAGISHTLKHIVQWSDRFHGWFLLNCSSMDESDGSIQLFVAIKGEIEVTGNIYE